MSSINKQTIGEFIKDLSSDSPTPGGGAVAALTGALAASLVEMVANLTIGKRGYERVQEEIEILRKKAIKKKKKLLELIDKDMAAFNQVVVAYKIPTKDQSREIKIQKALKLATEIPLETALLSNEVLHLAKEVAKKGNKNAISDAKSAQYFAQAAIKSALENVEINLAIIKDSNFKKKTRLAIARLE